MFARMAVRGPQGRLAGFTMRAWRAEAATGANSRFVIRRPGPREDGLHCAHTSGGRTAMFRAEHLWVLTFRAEYGNRPRAGT